MKKLTLIIFFFTTSIITNAQWVAQASGLIRPLTSTFFVNNNLGYCSADDGTIVKTINGGTNWLEVSGPHLPNGISQIAFTSVDTGFAVCGNGILKTSNGGVSWQNNFVDSNLVITLYESFPTNNIGYVSALSLGLDSIFIYKTTNAGNSWSKILSVIEPNGTNIYFTDANTGYINMNFGLYQTTNGGASWNLIEPWAPLGPTDFINSNIGYTITGDTLKTTTDAGNNWTSAYSSMLNPIYDMDFTNIDTGYAVGGNGFSSGMILKTVNGGTNWTLNLGITTTFLSIHFPSSNVGYACGDAGIIYKYSPTSGINDFQEINGVSIFPNPNIGKFNITFENIIADENYSVLIINVLGKTILKKEVDTNLEVDMSTQAKGIYFVKVENKNGMIVKKIIVE